MRIRQINPAEGDWELILNEMDLEVFPGLPPYPKLSAQWWIVEDEKEGVVAFAGLKVVDKHTGFLCRVGAIKGHRGYGVQKRLIRVRERKARSMGLQWLITYCHPANLASANNLIACGMRLYSPQNPYGVPGALYFRKQLTD